MSNKTTRGFAVAVIVTLGLAAANPAAAAEELSDATVTKYMDWAWQQLPEKFTEADGEVIQFDKSKKETILVPIETARDVIMAGWRSVRANACQLTEEQRANFESLKARENAKKKWSKQQTKFMLMLHLTVMQIMTGKIKITVRDGKTVVSEEELPKAIKPCAEGEKEKLKEAIAAYVKAGPHQTGTAPPPPPAAPAAAATAAPKAAEAKK